MASRAEEAKRERTGQGTAERITTWVKTRVERSKAESIKPSISKLTRKKPIPVHFLNGDTINHTINKYMNTVRGQS